MEAGKARLKGDTLRDDTQKEVKGLRQENARLKGQVGEQALGSFLLFIWGLVFERSSIDDD